MTENVNEPYEELEPDVADDDLDDSVSPMLGKVTEQEIPDYDPTVEFEGDENADN
jgi:hypothetical protein